MTVSEEAMVLSWAGATPPKLIPLGRLMVTSMAGVAEVKTYPRSLVAV